MNITKNHSIRLGIVNIFDIFDVEFLSILHFLCNIFQPAQRVTQYGTRTGNIHTLETLSALSK